MRLLTQNIKSGTIKVNDEIVARSDYGLAVFVAFNEHDEEKNIISTVHKLLKLRVLPDEFNKTNKNISDVGGTLLIIPNFTLYADVSSGNRPSFSKACPQDKAKVHYDMFINLLKRQYDKVEYGPFQAHMVIDLVNDGPFSIILDDGQK